jgi:hypothetical protein
MSASDDDIFLRLSSRNTENEKDRVHKAPTKLNWFFWVCVNNFKKKILGSFRYLPSSSQN